MSGWNFADVWEVVADTLPDATAQVQGDRRYTWKEFDERADGIGQWLLGIGAGQQDKVAQYLYNCPEYLESIFGIWKAGTVPVNTNYRYGDEELAVPVGQRRRRRRDLPRHVHRSHRRAARQVCRTSRAGCGSTTDRRRAPSGPIRTRTPPTWRKGRCHPPWGRDGDDLYMLYTGGTTGMPKGVMWRQDDIFATHQRIQRRRAVPRARHARRRARLAHRAGWRSASRRARSCTAPARSRASLRSCSGGSVVTLTQRTYSPEELLVRDRGERRQDDRDRRRRVRQADAARARRRTRPLEPLVAVRHRQLRRDVERADQAGPAQAPPADAVRRRVLVVGSARHGQLDLDRRRARRSTAKFTLGENAIVITEDGTPRRARLRRDRHGGGEGPHAGRLLQGPGEERRHVQDHRRRPLFDPRRLRHRGGRRNARAARPRFGVHQHRRREGVPRRSRGSAEDRPRTCATRSRSACPTRSSVRPSSRWSNSRPARRSTRPRIIAHVKTKLASFKAPKRVLQVETIGRAANGKVDYKRLTAEAEAAGLLGLARGDEDAAGEAAVRRRRS